MILIISESSDYSTHEVCKWLDFYNKKYFILNELSVITDVDFAITKNQQKFKITINESESYDLNEVNAIWQRRSLITFYKKFHEFELIKNESFNKIIKNFYTNELDALKQFIYKYLNDNCYTLGNFLNVKNYKLNNLIFALEVGLEIPETAIVSDKDNIQNIAKLNNNNLIIKPIKDGIFEFNPDTSEAIRMYTNTIDNTKIKKLEVNFPTLFQNNIEKSIEIRVFYLEGKCYSIAIYSQEKNKTRIDYRKYDLSNPNYFMPYKLPPEINAKIIKLMKKVNLNIGSIDLILSSENKFYFLEVNPVGQYDFVSKTGNYQIDKKIALTLIKNDKNRKSF